MREILLQGLMITVIGMGLVFLVIIFLWWLMGLLVKVTTRDVEAAAPEPIQARTADAGLVPEMAAIENQRRAAAAAVAVGLAIAEKQTMPTSAQATLGTMSPWQSVQRARGLQAQHKRG